MKTTRESLESLSRSDLIARARELRVDRAEVLTRVELVDEILRVSTPDEGERREVRGWLGVARDLLASIVGQGLNLPTAAALIRGDPAPLRAGPQPVATVTLAEIYAAQGHHDRALATLDEVLGREPDHAVAARLRHELARRARVAAAPPTAPAPGKAEPVAEPPPPEAQGPDLEPAGDDALAVVEIVPETFHLYWELGPRTQEHLRADRGAVRLRWVVFQANGYGVERVEEEAPAEAPSGTRMLPTVGPGAALRAVLGVAEGEHFRPLAVAVHLRCEGGAGPLAVVWAPRRRLALKGLCRRAARRAAAGSPGALPGK